MLKLCVQHPYRYKCHTITQVFLKCTFNIKSVDISWILWQKSNCQIGLPKKMRARTSSAQRSNVFNFIDTSVQKAGICGFSGCLQHANVIWHQIQQPRKKMKRKTFMWWSWTTNISSGTLDVILWTAFNSFQVPGATTKLVKSFFQNLRFCIIRREMRPLPGSTVRKV